MALKGLTFGITCHCVDPVTHGMTVRQAQDGLVVFTLSVKTMGCTNSQKMKCFKFEACCYS